jgi:hypothetical protein
MEILVQREALLRIKDFIFHRQPKDTMPKVIFTYHKPMEKLKQVVHCWKIDSDDVEEDDPRGVQINEFEGECMVQGKASSSTACGLWSIH